jgi:ABC-type Fe3+/spermidine/putrescine transport system ATPase subunit
MRQGLAMKTSVSDDNAVASTPAVEIRHLVKRFKGRGSDDFVAVNDVSLTVLPGQTVVLLGESGCGKTTTLRCLAGLESATNGDIRIDGVVVDDGVQQTPPESRRVGMVFQNYALWPHMSALKNVAFAGQRGFRGRKVSASSREQAADLLKTVGLSDKMGRLPGQLSGGQQQRVALARALAGDVRLLLMDEPLSALDQSLREGLRLELRTQIKRSGLACVYVTHDQQEALAMADVLVVMRAGRIEEIGDPQDIYENPRTAFGAAFLGAKNTVNAVVTRSGADFHEAEVLGDIVRFKTTGWTPSAGDHVELRWHPEHVDILLVDGDGIAKPNCWSGIVERSVYAGYTWEVSLTALGTSWRAWSRRQPLGQVSVSVQPEHISGYRCVPAESR